MMNMSTKETLEQRKKHYADMKKDGPAKRHEMHRVRAENHLEEIKKYLEAQSAKKDANWGNVGTMEHYADQLKDIADSIMNRGEYA